MIYPILTPEEAAEFVQHGMNVGVSGFTAPGCPKVVPPAIAAKARRKVKIMLFRTFLGHRDWPMLMPIL